MSESTKKSNEIFLGLLLKYPVDSFVVADEVSIRHNRKVRRIDFCALRRKALGIRSVTTGIEIKVSRSDFLSEIKSEKYKAMFPYCEETYFAVPPKLIKPTEVPAGMGLIEVTSSRARTVLKPPVRLIDASKKEALLTRVLYRTVPYTHPDKAKSIRIADRKIANLMGEEGMVSITDLYEIMEGLYVKEVAGRKDKEKAETLAKVIGRINDLVKTSTPLEDVWTEFHRVAFNLEYKGSPVAQIRTLANNLEKKYLAKKGPLTRP